MAGFYITILSTRATRKTPGYGSGLMGILNTLNFAEYIYYNNYLVLFRDISFHVLSKDGELIVGRFQGKQIHMHVL